MRFYLNVETCPKKEQGDKSMLCFGVKLCALTFTRAKLDVTLHSIQNINLGQNMAATSPVIKPIDCRKSTKVDQTPWLVV